ncbi:MAG: radical SAM protein [Deltaproteobacteria bacterium]|nr:radical SAM protein [Deltaproteobacteria bacterium]
MAGGIDAFEYLRQKARKSGSLLSLHFDITYRCPLKCIHCYIDHRRKNELSVAEIERILRDALRLNAMFITYSGGEVFEREDFKEILKITHRLNFSTKIITSGYLIGEKEVKLLKKYNIAGAGVSLYSLNPETHDKITGIKGSCIKTLRAIDLLKKAGINVVIKTSIMQDNYTEYTGLLKWIKSQGKNVLAQYDMVITPTMACREGVKELNLPYSKKKSLYDEIKRIEKKKEIKIEEMEDTGRKKAADSLTCYAGITGLYIAPDGKVYPCVEWDELIGDLRKESLIEIWKNSSALKRIRGLRIKDYKKCCSCKYLNYCSICPGLNLRDNNDLFSPSVLACERARMYYE